ncbi:MAG TPA: CdaR family protein [Dongiaceae bacterium]|nr:CdaR family protein [Dongiaceae bacterium]
MIALLRNLFLKDLTLKLFSLAMAILIYYTTSSFVDIKNEMGMAVTLRTFRDLPVLIVSSAADVRRFKVIPDTVDVTIQGDTKVLAGLRNNDIRPLVDLTAIESATDLRKRIEVSTPPGVTHIGVVPPDVRVIFPKQTTNR